MSWYSAVGRPLFFALPPEAAHRLVGAMLRLPMPWARIGGGSPDLRQAVELAGIPLRNPIGLAAGFDKGCRHLDSLGRLGFGYVVGGTVSHKPRDGNPKPRIARDPQDGSITNAMGLPTPGAEAAARNLASTTRTAPRFVSIADEELDDVVDAVGFLAPRADGVELNASSPNAGWPHRADHVADLLDAIRDRIHLPVFVKLPPFATDAERDEVLAMARVAVEHGAAGLTCSNTVPVQDRRLSTGRGGLSGRPLTSRTPRIVAEVHAATGGALPINACGGIFSASEALACIVAGATTVQVYSALIYEGPGIVGELTGGLARLLSERDATVPALVGASNSAR